MTPTKFLLDRIADDEDVLARGNPVRIHIDPGGNGDSSFPFRDRWAAECKVKREMVEVLEIGLAMSDDPANVETCTWFLHTLAAVYADHPDYDSNWTTS